MTAVPAPAPIHQRLLSRWSRLRPLSERVQQVEARYLQRFAVRQVIKGLLDFSFALVAVSLAFGLGERTPYDSPRTVAIGAATGLVLVACHALAGSYRSIWRYASMHDVIVVGASSGVVCLVLLLAHSFEFLALSPSTIALSALLIFFACTAVRALRRWQVAELARPVRPSPVPTGHAARQRLLIAGAGEHGRWIAREITRTAPTGVELVGFLDDDPSKLGADLQGIPVFGPLADALQITGRLQIDEVIVAMPAVEPRVERVLVRSLEDAGIRVRGSDVYRPGTATLAEVLEGTHLRARPRSRSEGSPRRVLVTGGAGYIGSHLCHMLLDRGYRVRVLDRFDYGRAGIESIADHPQLEVLEGDICNSRDVSRAVRNVDGVMALAALVGDGACSLDAEETINLNYTATKILVEACNFYSVRRLVFASSCSVYGAGSQDLLTERSRLSPVSLYARTRLLSEHILFDRHDDVEVVVLRLATVFGLSPRMRFDLVVNGLTAGAVVDRKIAIFGGNQWRPNVHCRDAARAFILAFEAPAAAVAGEVFNVGGDALNHRIDELGDMVARCVEGVEVVRQNDVADPRDYHVSFAKIRRILGFEPEMSVVEGVREIAAAMRLDSALQRYQEPLFHNVHSLKQVLSASRRRRDGLTPSRTVGVA